MPIERLNRSLQPWYKIPLCYPAVLTPHPSLLPSRGEGTILEIGPGRGDFLFYLAETRPEARIIGVELKSKRYFKLIDRIRKRKLSNVQVIQADGRIVVAEVLEPASISEVHINFPDPWPKNRHIKNRLMGPEFLTNCLRILTKGGTISFITDAAFYAEQVRKSGDKIGGLEMSCVDSVETYPTFFAQKWQKEGRKFYGIKWIKK